MSRIHKKRTETATAYVIFYAGLNDKCQQQHKVIYKSCAHFKPKAYRQDEGMLNSLLLSSMYLKKRNISKIVLTHKISKK